MIIDYSANNEINKPKLNVEIISKIVVSSIISLIFILTNTFLLSKILNFSNQLETIKIIAFLLYFLVFIFIVFYLGKNIRSNLDTYLYTCPNCKEKMKESHSGPDEVAIVIHYCECCKLYIEEYKAVNQGGDTGPP